jgi:hypothetical protein
MDYDALCDYLKKIYGWFPPSKIAWDCLEWKKFDIVQKDKLRMLQAADLISGALSDALEFTRLGNIEPQYILTLKDRIYARGNGLNRVFSYGLKFSHVKGDTLAEHEGEYPWLKQL